MIMIRFVLQIFIMGAMIPQRFKASSQVIEEVKKYSLPNKDNHRIDIQSLKPVPIYHFRAEKSLNPEKQFGVYELPERISVLTYNIWFEGYNMENRNRHILKLLSESNADFICLQEVTQTFLNELHQPSQKPWLKDYYMSGVKMAWYDTLILSKYRCRFYKQNFPTSSMSRSLLLAQMVISGGDNIIVGCMHYESLNTAPERVKQMKQVDEVTKKAKRVIIAGDYNFSDNMPENKEIPKQYRDLWIEVKKNLLNSETMPENNRFPKWRPDHILVKSPHSLEGATIEKIGEFVIAPHLKEKISDTKKDGIVRTPSDHFGLLADIPIFKISENQDYDL